MKKPEPNEPKRSKAPRGISIQPAADRKSIDAWFAEMDRFAEIPFMEEGREQPPMPTGLKRPD